MKIKNAEDITCFVVVRPCNKFKNAPILPGSCCVTHFVFPRRFRIFCLTNNAPQKLRQNMISHCLRQRWEQRQNQTVVFHAFWSQFISCIWCYWHFWASVEFEVWECGLLFRCASISWFEVISGWVSDFFTASASTALSDFFLSEKASFGRQLFNLLSIRMFFSSKSWNIDWTLSLFPFLFIRLSSILLRSKIM